jgi:hypothetical protein
VNNDETVTVGTKSLHTSVDGAKIHPAPVLVGISLLAQKE